MEMFEEIVDSKVLDVKEVHNDGFAALFDSGMILVVVPEVGTALVTNSSFEIGEFIFSLLE